MEERLILHETAVVAKEKGFDWDCYNEYHSKGYSYREGKPGYSTVTIKKGQLERAGEGQVFRNLNDNFSAPTQSLLQKWLREEHNIDVAILPWKDHCVDVNDKHTYRPMIYKVKTFGEYATYEDALEVGLLEALKLI